MHTMSRATKTFHTHFFGPSRIPPRPRAKRVRLGKRASTGTTEFIAMKEGKGNGHLARTLEAVLPTRENMYLRKIILALTLVGWTEVSCIL